MAAPVLSTPDTHIFEDPTPAVDFSSLPKLSNEQLYLQYEIKRTVREIRDGRWRRIGLQFPDDMLVDAPRVYEALEHDLGKDRISHEAETTDDNADGGVDGLANSLEKTKIQNGSTHELEEKLTILGDTSYGACCVDEVAAEHVDAEVVVHYGRSCLSPTARLPVIYVFTSRPLDLDAVVASFQDIYPDKEAKVVLMADIPYNTHVPELSSRLGAAGYTHLFAPTIIHKPSSLLPNRTVPTEAEIDESSLTQYSLFHISDPPTSLLLNISSRVSSIYIYPTTVASSSEAPSAVQASTAQALRRRYALVTRLATAPTFGILINTLSVKNYMSALSHVQALISRAGKKSYTFVVGKVNAAKVANFSDVDGWVVIGCWESSLIESKDFWKPIITPFELELALTDEKERLWTGQWNSDFESLLGKERGESQAAADVEATGHEDGEEAEDSDEESEPPVFDLRTGRYVSQSKPMARSTKTRKQLGAANSLIKRANGDLAQIGGEISPAAEYLRTKRTWQGLGSDYEIAYDYDDAGKIQGAQMEEGRSGIAKGYVVGSDVTHT